MGGIVGVLGGLGGFFCPILFGYMLEWTGLWITCGFFFAGLAAVCLCWMHVVIQQTMNKEAVVHAQKIEYMVAAVSENV